MCAQAPLRSTFPLPARAASPWTINGTEYNAGTTASLIGQGLFVLNTNGSYFFTPSANFNGTVPAISYTVTDGSLTSTATLNLTVTAVNDAPVGTNDTVAGTEDVAITGNLVGNDSDLDGDTLTVTQFTINGQTKSAGQTATLTGVGSLTVNADGSYSFTPAANYFGAVPVATVTITDGAALQFTGLPFFAPEMFMTVILKNPLRTKQLQTGLEQLGEEGAIQVFKPEMGGAMLLGAIGQLQFEVVQHRLRGEYDCDVRLENSSYTGARWISADTPAELKEFINAYPQRMATDAAHSLAYLCTSPYDVRLAQERFPKIHFHPLREHAGLALGTAG